MPLNRNAFRDLVLSHTSSKSRVTDVTCVTASYNNNLTSYRGNSARVTCVTGALGSVVERGLCNPEEVSCVTGKIQSNQLLSSGSYTVTQLHNKNGLEKNQTLTALLAIDAVDWLAHFEERAAIREYDGGLPRGEAEKLAGADTVVALGPCPVAEVA